MPMKASVKVRHVAIIMDGNGRWAKQRGLPRVAGHQAGVDAIRRTVTAAAELEIPYLTLYAFSTENWLRPKAEVNSLMELLVATIQNEAEDLRRQGVRLRFIGDIEGLPAQAQESVRFIETLTQSGRRLTLVVALNYGSRKDILAAARRIAREGENALQCLQTPDDFKRYLSTADIPDPDILIRTSGEQRISNFLLWECAYTELFFPPVLWPDFGKDDLVRILEEFSRRERRFGMTSEQLRDS